MSNKLTSLRTDLHCRRKFFPYIYCRFGRLCARVLIYCVILYSQDLLWLCADFGSGNKRDEAPQDKSFRARMRSSPLFGNRGNPRQQSGNAGAGRLQSGMLTLRLLVHMCGNGATHLGGCTEPWRKRYHNNNWILTARTWNPLCVYLHALHAFQSDRSCFYTNSNHNCPLNEWMNEWMN